MFLEPQVELLDGYSPVQRVINIPEYADLMTVGAKKSGAANGMVNGACYLPIEPNGVAHLELYFNYSTSPNSDFMRTAGRSVVQRNSIK